MLKYRGGIISSKFNNKVSAVGFKDPEDVAIGNFLNTEHPDSMLKLENNLRDVLNDIKPNYEEKNEYSTLFADKKYTKITFDIQTPKSLPEESTLETYQFYNYVCSYNVHYKSLSDFGFIRDIDGEIEQKMALVPNYEEKKTK